MTNKINPTFINHLAEIISENINQLNSGGCGIFAEYIGQEFERYGIDYQILLCDEPHKSFEDWKNSVQNALNNKEYNKFRLSASHFLIMVNGYIFDGYGLVGVKVMGNYNWYENTTYKPIGSYTLDEMRIANKLGRWNNSYDRTQNDKLNKPIFQLFFVELQLL